MSNFKIRAIK